MTNSNDGVPTPREAEFPARPGPVNLTEAAGRMSWLEAEQALGVSVRSGGSLLEIRAAGQDANEYSSDGGANTIYVVVAGYGMLHCKVDTFEITKDDVIFVPAGCPHRFERLDGDLLFWRICVSESASRPDASEVSGAAKRA